MNVTAPWRVAICAGAFSAGVATAEMNLGLTLAAAAGVCITIAISFADRRLVTALVAVASCAIGAWRGASAVVPDRGTGAVSGHLGSGSVLLRGMVADAGVPGRSDTIVVDVHDLATAAGTWHVSGAAVVEPRSPTAVLPGDTVDVQTTSLRAPPQRPGSLSVGALERVGVTAIASAAQVTVLAQGGPSPARLAQQVRGALGAVVARALPEPEATLVLGVAFGIHARITGAVRAPLQNAGLIHVVAVSGLKVVMVAALVEALARVRHWSRRGRVAATMTTILLYVVLSGAGAAALRSSMMIGAGLLLNRDGRRPHSFALLGICAAVLLAIEPAVATDIGFQLSFLGTAGILVLAAPIAARLPGPRLLVEPFAVTIAAQLATAPVTAGTFGVLSVVGPLANALVLPVLPGIIVAGGLGALVGGPLPALGWLPLQLAALGVRALLAIAQGAAALPFAALHLQLWPATWTLAALLILSAGAAAWFANERWLLFRARSATVAVVAAALAASATLTLASLGTTGVFRLTVLDVGNGVAVLIRTPDGGAVLVDGGSDGPGLITALGRVMSPLDRHLDAVALTGTDRATAAALPSLLGHYDIGTVVISQPAPPALQTTLGQLAGAGTRVVVAGSVPWSIGRVGLRCIPTGPASSAPCVMQVSDGNATAVITGNLPQASQDELAAVARNQLHGELLVAPTTTAPSAALVGVVGPQLVAVPARRLPPGVSGLGLDVAVTGRDSDLVYTAAERGGFASALG